MDQCHKANCSPQTRSTPGKNAPLPIPRHVLVCLAAAVGLAWSSYASAFVKGGMSFPHAMTPTFLWSEPVDMHLSGVPIVVRSFVASATLDEAAKMMARHQKHFQRVTTLPGSILLSGVYADRHWVAQLDAGPRHVKGLVSALPMNLKPMRKEGHGGALGPWLTQNASLIFSQSSTELGHTITHSVHRPQVPVGQFITAMDRRMMEAGWQPIGTLSWAKGIAEGRSNEGGVKLFPVMATEGGGDLVLVSQSD